MSIGSFLKAFPATRILIEILGLVQQVGKVHPDLAALGQHPLGDLQVDQQPGCFINIRRAGSCRDVANQVNALAYPVEQQGPRHAHLFPGHTAGWR